MRSFFSVFAVLALASHAYADSMTCEVSSPSKEVALSSAGEAPSQLTIHWSAYDRVPDKIVLTLPGGTKDGLAWNGGYYDGKVKLSNVFGSGPIGDYIVILLEASANGAFSGTLHYAPEASSINGEPPAMFLLSCEGVPPGPKKQTTCPRC
jgi:hypothetical protein